MDKSSLMACRHGFLVIRRRLPKNYVTIKKRKKETYKVIVSFMYSPVHRSGRIVLFPVLRDVGEN